MKNILIILFFLAICNNSFAQKKSDNISKLSGTWAGKMGEDPIQFQVVGDSQNSFTFSFINFQNERFTVQKSDVSTNEKNEFIINIKEAKFSSSRFEKCVFSKGTITISDFSENHMKLNLKSVGPNCFLSYDVIMNMPDMDDTVLTKEKIK
ncbi:hypothetical protein [Chryseobacterium sp. W4I1]|uniref:hypothetical protein n=1 Tax=Chryseobacterium sp. W4I1 TaxID=3042293 RepID=UPI00278992FE|nr:hypothetical protein [Chryseobacterium sp. W4I1]MDQ0783654.1 hypothetical protein [Chryseobacterium sp. W4I1]